MNNYRPTYADVDLSALRHNVRWLKERAGAGIWFCPMVKANAYGHGAVAIAQALSEMKVDALGVALVEEGLILRQAGIQVPLLVFSLFSEAAAEACVANNLTPVLSRQEDLQFFKDKAASDFQVHLKFNTGMNRLGFEVNEAAQVAEFFKNQSRLKLTGLCSHLVQGEDWSQSFGQSGQQAEALKVAAKFFQGQPILHLLNSAALLSPASARGFGVRPGIAVYGGGANGTPLKPVMHLRSEVAMIHKIKAGQGVSYNSRWRASQDSVIAVVPLGYGDGFFRLLTNRAQALVRGQRVPLVGTVCM
ncbi:MAG: alanine racemase, partial [Bdellovibrionales bacterium]